MRKQGSCAYNNIIAAASDSGAAHSLSPAINNIILYKNDAIKRLTMAWILHIL